MKTIIALRNRANKGKTRTLQNLAQYFINTYPNLNQLFLSSGGIPQNDDFRFIFKLRGKSIAIESQGDLGTDLEYRLNEIIQKYKCDIIFCSTRTRGETVHAVNNFANQNNFSAIWTSTYQIEGQSQQQIVNQLKAEHLHELLVKLKLV